MSIRIHRCIGYAIGDIQYKDGLLSDPRFKEGALERIYDKFDDNNFLDWIEKNPKKALEVIHSVIPLERVKFCNSLDVTLTWKMQDRKKEEKIKWSSYPIIYDPEFADPSVLMMVPIEADDWARYDDIIDYYECENLATSIKWLNDRCGIYPHVGAYLRRDAEPIEGIKTCLEPMEWNQLRGSCWGNVDFPIEGVEGEEIAQLVNERYHVILPHSVILMVYWLDIFKDWKSAIYQLRPAIYTYWS